MRETCWNKQNKWNKRNEHKKQVRKTCWNRNERNEWNERKKQAKERYYKNLLKTYQPSELGLSTTREVLHYFKIQMSEKNGGGKAIYIVLHFLLQNKVTYIGFNKYYELALEYALKTLSRGKVYYDNLQGRSVENVLDVEQLMRENLRASGVKLSVREFMRINSSSTQNSSV